MTRRKSWSIDLLAWHWCLTLTIDTGYLGWSANRVEIPTLGLTVGRF